MVGSTNGCIVARQVAMALGVYQPPTISTTFPTCNKQQAPSSFKWLIVNLQVSNL
jgi:hypothetical protein